MSHPVPATHPVTKTPFSRATIDYLGNFNYAGHPEHVEAAGLAEAKTKSEAQKIEPTAVAAPECPPFEAPVGTAVRGPPATREEMEERRLVVEERRVRMEEMCHQADCEFRRAEMKLAALHALVEVLKLEKEGGVDPEDVKCVKEECRRICSRSVH